VEAGYASALPGLSSDQCAMMITMNGYERHWVAGILEGEGCFAVQKTKVKNIPRIQVSMSDRDIIERLAQIVGWGNVGGPYFLTKNTNRPGRKDHKPMYRWALNGKRASELGRNVYPLLSERRRAYIDENWV
jgi:hypothetical protein